MRVFVAGATGAIGRQLLPMLLSAGHQVIAMARTTEAAAALELAGAQPVLADAFDRERVVAAVRAARPDTVMHQLTSLGTRDFASNSKLRMEATPNLVDAALAAGARRIVAQSISFAYAPGAGPAREDEPLDVAADGSRRGMVAGVVALETAARRLPEWVVLRYGLLYGPGTWYAPDGFLADEARQGRLPATDAVESFVHVRDAAAAAVAALDWPSGIANIVDDEPAPGTAWVPAFAAWVGAPSPETRHERQPFERGASNEKARRVLGWTPEHATWRVGFSD